MKSDLIENRAHSDGLVVSVIDCWLGGPRFNFHSMIFQFTEAFKGKNLKNDCAKGSSMFGILINLGIEHCIIGEAFFHYLIPPF